MGRPWSEAQVTAVQVGAMAAPVQSEAPFSQVLFPSLHTGQALLPLAVGWPMGMLIFFPLW